MSVARKLRTIYTQLRNYELKPGLNESRNVTGFFEPIYTPDDLRHVVFDTALEHIEQIEKLLDIDRD